MQAEKELKESTSQFLSDAMKRKPQNRHERRAQERAGRLATKRAKIFLMSLDQLKPSH